MESYEITEGKQLSEKIESLLKKLDLYFYEVRGHKRTSNARKKISKMERDLRALQAEYTL